MEHLEKLRKLIDQSRRIVFFGGAGVSTESGIPDFRSEQGVFKALEKFGHSPEELLSIGFFRRNPTTFFDYHKTLMIAPDAKPNAAHLALARLEQAGKLTAVVTQNIDGLHQLAGSQNVLELHGSNLRNYCCDCHRQYTTAETMEQAGIPRCACGGIIRPDIVMYGEQLDDRVVSAAVRHIQDADLMIVGGTSLVVYPAAGLISYFGGKQLVLINKSETSYDSRADLVIHEAIGQVLGAVVD